MTTSKLNQAEFAAKVKSQRDNLDKIIHRLKSIAVNRYVIEGNNQYADERDWLLNELSRIEAEIPKIKSDAEVWINMQQKDISQFERTISRANVREKPELQTMIDIKHSEVKFLKEQIICLNGTLNHFKDLIIKKTTHAYFYSYRLEHTITPPESNVFNGVEIFDITAHPSKILLKLKIHLPDTTRRDLECEQRHLKAYLRKDNTVFISTTYAYPRKLGIGTLLLKALESQLSPGTELSLMADGDSPGYWQKMGFSCDFSTKICHKMSNY